MGQIVDKQNGNKITLQAYFESLVKADRVKATTMYAKALRSLQNYAQDESCSVAALNESLLEGWVKWNMEKLTRETAVRYVESMKTIYACALEDGFVENTHLMSELRLLVKTLCKGGWNKESQKLVEDIRELTTCNDLKLTCLRMSVDVYLYSFFQGVVPIENLINLRMDERDGVMPQCEAIVRRYQSPGRKYVFPLQQGRTTNDKIKDRLEFHFKEALRLKGFSLGTRTPEQFLVNAWIACAKDAHVDLTDMCGCSDAAKEILTLKDVTPVTLEPKRKQTLLKKVANTLVDMKRHWYAIRFVGDEKLVREDIESLSLNSPVKIYYPMEEICKKVGKRRKMEVKPVVRNVLFVETMPRDVDVMARKTGTLCKYYVINNNMDGTGGYAIIPNAQMRRFSALVSNGLDIMGEDEMRAQEIVSGAYVHITEGLFKDYCGKVLKVRNRKTDKESTMLEIEVDKMLGPELASVLDKKIYITVSQEIVENSSTANRKEV